MKEKKTIDQIILTLDSLVSDGEKLKCGQFTKSIAADGKVLSWLESNYPEAFDFSGLSKKERDLIDLCIMRSSTINIKRGYTPECNGLKYLMDSCILCSTFLEEYKNKEVNQPEESAQV
ncbi:MAG TPA: hypothetical protein DIT04_08500 [Dysgonomonas sp.]|nr:hypothetical protein [Dysgonomonas sp.]